MKFPQPYVDSSDSKEVFLWHMPHVIWAQKSDLCVANLDLHLICQLRRGKKVYGVLGSGFAPLV